VAEERDRGRILHGFLDALQNGARRVVGRRSDLGDRDLAGVFGKRDEVRERAASVYGDAIAAHVYFLSSSLK
jgi:hypothetical protein